MAILTHSGGPASSLADACNRWGLHVPLFSEGLQEKIRKLLPATASHRNPVDLTFFMNMRILMETIPQIILEDPSIDGLLIHGIQGGRTFLPLAEVAKTFTNIPSYEEVKGFFLAPAEALVGLPKKFGKPIITSAFGDRGDEIIAFIQDQGIPCYGAPERAAGAMAALCRYAEIRSRK
jgi:acyl-CoA synthetase (NDP forming)